MKSSRRDFLKVAALGAGATLLGTTNLQADEKERAFVPSNRDYSKQKALLLSSSGYKDTGFLTHAVDWINDLIIKPNNLQNKKIVFIPYANLRAGYDKFEEKLKKALERLNLNIVSIHHAKDPVKEIESADCIFVGGGNTFKLVHDLYENKLVALISQKVANGTPYIGWSAGANVAGASMMTTNDMPIIEPESFNTFSIFPHQINPHFISGKPVGHNGESREERLEEFLIANQNSTVYALPEGSAFLIDGKKAKFISMQPAPVGSALIFKYKKDIEKMAPNTVFEY
ncbi:dipeptidase PepE [Campylobacter californiensis]|uniref:dipeptidase PepE n=1 Tax=Campylobacter californiensis TaxID=1032243 RepID=UPI001474EB1F|nr:dipeptidase PepE [Campylobacter sp. RM12916]MBE3610257.1 dipeptidase PepE [Campylobacter sp. RM12916]